ncbi:MAG TPA: SurA N-terminal domain-containing protein [Pseudonocardiaceae bacterium]|jgi:hypothetical protein|nr:SurA N-terminal domain-containing protein [Pseudonocardiaceae bacterium]
MVIGRKTGLLATVAVAGLLLVSCDSGAGQAGSAAIVNGQAISLDAVQQELNSELANAPAPADGSQPTSPAQDARQIVTNKVMDQVVSAAIGKYHLNVTDQSVSQFLDENGGLDKLVSSSGLSSQDIQDIGRNDVALLDYAQKYLLKLRMIVDFVLVNDQKTALATANKLAANPGDVKSILQSVAGPSGQTALGQQLTGGVLVSNEVQYEQQQQQGSSSGGSEGGSVLEFFAAQPNTAMEFQYSSQQWMVALVEHVDTDGVATSDDTAALGQLAPQAASAGAADMLSPLAQQLGIRISPRYGIWDPVGMQVVASADQSTGIEVPEHK